MGALLSNENSSKTIQPPKEQNVKSAKINNDFQDIHNINDSELFDKIAQLSNNLLMEYGNYYLKPDFCNTISIIYKKKLSKLNIDILKYHAI